MPPSCARAIAMSASVTVSIADDRIGMLSGISRVRKVGCRPGSAGRRIRAAAAGRRRTSDRGECRAVSLSWAISAHDRRRPIRQVAARPRPAPAPAAAASTCMRSIISSSNRSAPPWNASTSALARARPRPRSGAKARWHGSIWLGWIRLLPSKPSAPPSAASRSEALGIVEPVEHAVEHRDAGGPRGKHDQLQRSRDRLARRVRAAGGGRRAGRWCRQSARRTRGRSPPRPARLPQSRSSPAPACRLLRRHRGPRCAEIARGTTTKSAFDRATASRSSECHSVPTPLTRIATGIGQSSATASTAASRAAALSSGFTASSRSSTTRSAPRSARLGDRPRVGRRQEQHRPHGEQVECSCRFSLPLRAMAVASCPGTRSSGK